jgi:hypothetical protein
VLKNIINGQMNVPQMQMPYQNNFLRLVAGEEEHYDTELKNIDKFGANYLALQSIERSKTNASNPSSGK